MKLLNYAICAAIIVASSSCDMREARLKSFDKDHWIQVALGTPLPSGMTELQGIGDTWQGFWCHFRFRIPAANLETYLETNGYEEHPASDFVRNFTIDPRFEKYFSPAWNPVLDPSSKVFVRNPSDYSSYILIGPDSDQVHVWTGGSHSPGPFPANQQAQQGVGGQPATPPRVGD